MAISFSNNSVSSSVRARFGVIPSPCPRLLAASVSFHRSPSCCSLKKISGLCSGSFCPRRNKASLKVSVSNAEVYFLLHLIDFILVDGDKMEGKNY